MAYFKDAQEQYLEYTKENHCSYDDIYEDDDYSDNHASDNHTNEDKNIDYADYARNLIYQREEAWYDYDLYRELDRLEEIFKNSTFITIFFTDIKIQEEVFIRLSKLKYLSSLKLSFLGSNITKLPESLFYITSLKVLHISNIKIKELSSAISNLKNLEELTVIQTEITTLPDSIAELTGLRILEVEINWITHLPSSIGELKELRSLCLLDNILTNLPESILELPKLQELNIMYNTSALVTDNTVALLKTMKPMINIKTHQENSTEHLDLLRYESVHAYFKTLDTSKHIYANFEVLQSACEELVKNKFGKHDEEIFNDNVRTLKDLLIPTQAWHQS